MIDNKKRKISKKKITFFSCFLLLIFLYIYNVSITYYGTVEIREMKQNNNEYIVVVEGDFGVKKSSFNERDTFNIVENKESRVGNITDIWNKLSESESFHVRLKAYDNRNKFVLERIYIK